MKRAITEGEIKASMTPNGGWTKDVLAQWGVPWPPPKGWKEILLSTGVPYRHWSKEVKDFIVEQKHHEALKPCPFCGGKGTMFARAFPVIGTRFSVGCKVCDFTRDDRCIDEMSAAALWNSREMECTE